MGRAVVVREGTAAPDEELLGAAVADRDGTLDVIELVVGATTTGRWLLVAKAIGIAIGIPADGRTEGCGCATGTVVAALAAGSVMFRPPVPVPAVPDEEAVDVVPVEVALTPAVDCDAAVLGVPDAVGG